MARDVSAMYHELGRTLTALTYEAERKAALLADAKATARLAEERLAGSVASANEAATQEQLAAELRKQEEKVGEHLAARYAKLKKEHDDFTAAQDAEDRRVLAAFDAWLRTAPA